MVKVTNLNSNGPGSLQAACELEDRRIVVFEVGRVIRGDVAIKHSYITIAGQTAPNPGIIIEGGCFRELKTVNGCMTLSFASSEFAHNP